MQQWRNKYSSCQYMKVYICKSRSNNITVFLFPVAIVRHSRMLCAAGSVPGVCVMDARTDVRQDCVRMHVVEWWNGTWYGIIVQLYHIDRWYDDEHHLQPRPGKQQQSGVEMWKVQSSCGCWFVTYQYSVQVFH